MSLQVTTAAECSQETATSLTRLGRDKFWSNPMETLALHIHTVLPLSLVVQPGFIHVDKNDIMKSGNVGQ